MKVIFRNSYTKKVWVAVMYYDPHSCGEYGNWTTAGWWAINPGKEAWAFSTSNRYACFYAEAHDGTIWTGHYGPAYVYHEAFKMCIDIGSNVFYEIVGMRLIDLGWWAWWPGASFTVNLVR
jgi:hypothetical protein